MKEFELTRRKILAGVGAAGVASVGAGLGTSAYFSDTETYEGNQLVAGELDMKVAYSAHYSDWSEDEGDGVNVSMWDGAPSTTGGPADLTGNQTGLPTNAAWQIAVDDPGQFLANTQYASAGDTACDGTDAGDLEQPVIDIEDVKPGDFGEVTFDFSLCDNPGYVWLQGELQSCSENGVTEPEAEDEDENEDEPRPPENNGTQTASLGALAALAGAPLRGDDSEEAESGSLSKRNALRGAVAGAAGLAGLAGATGSATAQQSSFDVVPKSDSGATAQDLADALIGSQSGISVTSASYTGADIAAGTFSDGNSLFGIEDGIILSSGAAENIEESAGGADNNDDGISLDNQEPGDADLLSLAQATDNITDSTNDACVLEFDFEVPEGEEQVFFNFVFGSDEYNEYAPGGANALFNDVFGFFINPESGTALDTNAATINGDPVSIDTINQQTNSGLYNNNDPSDTNTPFATEADGFSDRLQVQADVNPGETNTFKLAVADANDFILDTWVLIEGESLSTEPEPEPEPDECPDVELLDVVQAAAWVDDGNNYQNDDEAPAIVGSLRDVLSTLSSGQGLALAGDIPAEEGGGTGRNCFSAGDEHSVAFAWWVPVDHGNEIQTDSASFDLGFYTEQCRHNDGSGMPTEASVTFEDQQSDGSSVLVDSVTLPEGGYVVIHESDGGAPGPVLGNSPYLSEGTSSDVSVALDSPISADQELIAMAHTDDGDQQYEFPNADGPYTTNGSAVIDPAQITVTGGT